VKPDFAQYGFDHQENLIMACIGGSQAHGAKVGATDDTDWYGYIVRRILLLLWRVLIHQRLVIRPFPQGIQLRIRFNAGGRQALL
jgi:hypothetical protein